MFFVTFWFLTLGCRLQWAGLVKDAVRFCQQEVISWNIIDCIMAPLAIVSHYPVSTWNLHASSKPGIVCTRIYLDTMWKVRHRDPKLSCLLHACCVRHKAFQQRDNILNMLAITLKVMKPLTVCLWDAIFKPVFSNLISSLLISSPLTPSPLPYPSLLFHRTQLSLLIREGRRSWDAWLSTWGAIKRTW